MAMSNPPEYGPIDPTTFDLVIVGTGLPESVIAAAASACGKSVLHLDPNDFYGSHFASLSLPELASFLNSNSEPTSPPPPPSATAPDGDSFVVELNTRPLYSNIEISSFSQEVLEEHSQKFYVDVSGPRVLLCADRSIDFMLKSGVNSYLEFKAVEASCMGDENGKMWNVPDSRAAIFKDKSLSLMEKNQLMRFFKLVQGHLASGGDTNEEDENGKRISGEDLESPFVDFLTKMRLPSKIKSIILYAIAMADYDQDNVEVCTDLLKTKDGIDRLALYQLSFGRFTNGLGAFIYPLYGQGELPQAFCRRAAVKGSLYVLRMPVTSLIMDKGSGGYRGVILASGQHIFSDKLVLDPSFSIPSPSASLSDIPHESLCILSTRDVKGKVARGICITRSSLRPDISTFLIIYPPKSLYPEQVTSIRALQIGGTFAICPPGMFVLYLSALCDDVNQGKKLLNAAMKALLTFPDNANNGSSSTVLRENSEEKPSLLWSATYIQELTVGQCNSIISTPMPDGNLNYGDLLDEAMKLFQKLFPNEEFFPETSLENTGDDDGLALDT